MRSRSNPANGRRRSAQITDRMSFQTPSTKPPKPAITNQPKLSIIIDPSTSLSKDSTFPHLTPMMHSSCKHSQDRFKNIIADLISAEMMNGKSLQLSIFSYVMKSTAGLGGGENANASYRSYVRRADVSASCPSSQPAAISLFHLPPSPPLFLVISIVSGLSPNGITRPLSAPEDLFLGRRLPHFS